MWVKVPPAVWVKPFDKVVVPVLALYVPPDMVIVSLWSTVAELPFKVPLEMSKVPSKCTVELLELNVPPDTVTPPVKT